MFLPRAIDHLIKPQKQALEALVWVIGQGCPRESQNIVGSCHCLVGNFHNVWSKTQFLETLCSSDTGPWGSWAGLTGNPFPEEMILPSFDTYEQQRAWHNNTAVL